MKEKVDIVIIGSGVAAASLSQRLLDKDPKRSILLLEAGTKVPMKDFALYQNYLITGEYPYAFCEDLPYPSLFDAGENVSATNNKMQLNGSRAMMYGGSTTHWGGWSFRFKPEDFNLHSNTGIKNTIDWPIDYDDLEPYYSQAEHYIGVSGDSNSGTVPRSKPYPFPFFPYTLEDGPIIDAYKKLNFEYNHLPIARHGITNTESRHAPCKTTGTCKYCPFGARYATANFLDDMVQYGAYPNFEIRTGAVVDEIKMASKKRAAGVIYHNRFEDDPHVIEAEKVIVAAGAIEAAKLLQRSTSYWSNGVGNHKGKNLVGKNFVSHPFAYWDAKVSKNPDRLQPEMDFPTLVSRHFDSLEQQPHGKFITVHLNSFSPTFDVNSNNATTTLTQAMQNGYNRDQINEIVKGPMTVQLITQIEVFSELSNYVANTNVINHLGLRETYVEFVPDKRFEKQLKRIKSLLAPVFKEMGATDLNMKFDSIRADHASCLTRMSDSPDTGVVDKNLKVFGTDNVYVLSNASFSSLSAVNPTLTLTALSLRLGDHLNAK